MEIKPEKLQSIITHKIGVILNNSWKKIVLLCILLIISFLIGGITRETGIWRKSYNVIMNIHKIPINYAKSFFLPAPQNLIIDIKFKNFKKILADRTEAIKDGRLLYPNYVPGTIGVNDNSYKVKLRLKGDFLEHIEGQKWSFRVKVKGENTILGMKIFSLQHPKMRNYLGEWLFHKVLKNNDIIGLRYDFVNVILNGKNLGLYNIEEHFEKRLIENNQKKEGPIIKFSEEGVWEVTAGIKDSESYLTSKAEGFGNSFNNTDNNLKRAVTMLENYRNKKSSFNDVFDIDIFAKHYAISRIFGAAHGERWHNRRFYYNPITDKLEPIGFDANAFGDWMYYDGNLFENKFLFNWMSSENKNYLLISKIASYLEQFSTTNFISPYENEISYFETIFSREFPYYQLDKSFLTGKQEYYRSVLYPSSANLLNCYFEHSTKDSIYFKIGNLQPWPVEIEGIVYDSIKKNLQGKGIIIPGRVSGQPVYFTSYSVSKNTFLSDSEFTPDKIQFMCKIIGTSKLTSVEITKWNYKQSFIFSESFVNKTSDLSKLPFIKIINGDKIVFDSGKHDIKNDINISGGFSILINENTTLNLLKGSSIVSRSPVYFLGSKENPVYITSTDSTGQGIFIIHAQGTSVLNHTKFIGLSNPEKNGWGLTGAVTFYESDVEINSCLFNKNLLGDDYLNIVRSNFSIDDTKFININADAFDSDYSNGTISNSQFINCGNDGLDISGSRVEVINVTMDNIGDKGLSAGENSHMTVNNFNISESAIGICSKDLSTIIGENIIMNNVQVGFTAFQKKPEFGPGRIECKIVTLKNIEIPYLIEQYSNCIVDHKPIKKTNKKVEEILYGVEYGEASK